MWSDNQNHCILCFVCITLSNKHNLKFSKYFCSPSMCWLLNHGRAWKTDTIVGTAWCRIQGYGIWNKLKKFIFWCNLLHFSFFQYIYLMVHIHFSGVELYRRISEKGEQLEVCLFDCIKWSVPLLVNWFIHTWLTFNIHPTIRHIRFTWGHSWVCPIFGPNSEIDNWMAWKHLA